MAQHSTLQNAWPGGWVVAVVAALAAAMIARWLGDAAMPAAVLAGAGVFVVFGVLLGMFWAEPVSGPVPHGHGLDVQASAKDHASHTGHE